MLSPAASDIDAEGEVGLGFHGQVTRLVLAVSVAAAASVVNARDDEPSWEAIREYAGNYMQQLKKEGLSVRETANQLASSIWWSEKLQLLCPSYFYVNARRACYDYLLRQGTWNMMFGVTCH
jgi:hypothetical protein